MRMISYRGYLATVEFDPDDQIFFGRVAGIEDAVGFHGDTVRDLIAAFHEAVDDYIATCAEIGKAPEKSYSGNLMLRVDPGLHAEAAAIARLAGKSLNVWGEAVLREAVDRAKSQAVRV